MFSAQIFFIFFPHCMEYQLELTTRNVSDVRLSRSVQRMHCDKKERSVHGPPAIIFA